jgi:hypothetical protein
MLMASQHLEMRLINFAFYLDAWFILFVQGVPQLNVQSTNQLIVESMLNCGALCKFSALVCLR